VRNFSPHLETLAQLAHPDGGWGYVSGNAAQLEPTCLGLLALSLEKDKYQELIAKGLHFLDQCAGADGGYRLARGRQEAIWPTAQVLFVRTVLGCPRESLNLSASLLLHNRGQMPKNCENQELHDINLKLVGWPWAENNFSWTEPTVWACLALRRLGFGEHPRVQEGMLMLLDRAMDDGGINYGNRKILGRSTEPIPGPSALMLLALQGSDHPRLAAAVHYLVKQMAGNDLEHLCWTKIAFDLHRQLPEAEEALSRLDAVILQAHQDREQASWLKPSPVRQALTALALATGSQESEVGGQRSEVGGQRSEVGGQESEVGGQRSEVGGQNFFRLPAELPGQQFEKLPAPAAKKKSALGQRIGTWFRGMAVKAAGQLRPLPMRSAVHIARAGSYDENLTDILHKQFEHFRAEVPLQGKRIVLKPNLVEYHRDKVINTNPLVVAAVIEMCRREGAKEIVVAEGPGHWRNVEYLVSASGLGDVLRKYQVPFVDINHDEPVKTPNLGRLTGLEYLYMSRTIAEAEVVISLPKMKTHHWAGATLSLKNLFGTLPGICYGWPKNELHWRGIDNSIVDIALTRTPDLAIVDGIIGMEGDGPLNGTAKQMGVLVMGHDLLAVDATCCRLMELDPERIGYLVLGHMKKLGRMSANEIQQLGETIAALAQPFETVPHLQNLRRKSA
jgi:uncharacterized protein (DUF362 family)